jgi:F420-non-reducing hydrogenase small subunit
MADSKAELVRVKTNGFEPRIVAFFCNWCTYLAADLAGTSRVKYAPNIRVIRTMCSGRVDLQFVLDAFSHGADGVLIGGCRPGDCHYQEGNYKTLRRVLALRPVLREMGIEDERFRLEWISASEAERLKTVVNDMVEKVRALGPRTRTWVPGAREGRGQAEPMAQYPSVQSEESNRPPEIEAFPASQNAEASTTNSERQEAASEPRNPIPVSCVASSKPKVAFYWCASCGGCEETVLDLDERVLDVVAAVDIVFWPVALDFKRRDVEAMPDGSILAAFVNGAVRNTEQQEMAHLLRKKSRILVALGSCAQLGGVPGLANLASRQSILGSSYFESPSNVNPEKVVPQTQHRVNGLALTLPELLETVHKLDDVLDVDYYLPGCPPTPKVLWDAVQVLLSGKLPPKGAVLVPDRALCNECPRQDTRPEKLTLKEFKRPQDVLIDEQKCLLAQGVVCLGPATRSGCEALCPKGNMACTGCFGPTSRVRDYGAKALSAFASIIDSNDPEEIERIVQTVPDPVGRFYRYSLPASSLHAK